MTDGITGARREGDIGFASLRGGGVVGEHAVLLLQKKGFRVARLNIGLPEWKLLGLPVEP